MVAIIGRGLVYLLGGWWAQRERCLRSRGLWGRLMFAVYRLNLLEHGSYISRHTRFAGPPIFPHGPTAVFIAPNARIGERVTIFHQVTIGANERAGSAREGSPTIGDGVFVGAGAQIIGNVHVGHGALIGAGAVVVDDVPPGATVVCPPPRVLVRDAERAAGSAVAADRQP